MNSKMAIGLPSCVLTIVGACIGSAIFSISGMTIWYAGASAIVSWIAAAFIYLLYGMILSELAVKYPYSGGSYVFPRRAIGGWAGSFLGFFCSWGYIVSNVIAIGFSAIYTGVFLGQGFPELCAALGGSVCVSILALAFCLVVLLLGGKFSQGIQNALVAALVATMLLYCGFAFFGGNFDADAFSNFWGAGVKGSSGFLSAIPLAIVAYGGCASIAFISAEVKNPGRNVPLSMFIGLGVTALFYAAIIAAIVGTLPQSIISEDETLRLSPIGASVSSGSLCCHPWIGKAVALCGIFALLTTITALLKVNARAVQAIAADGFLPKVFYRENKHSAAAGALIAMTLVCICLCLFASWAMEMIKLGALLNVVSMTIICLAHICSRHSGSAEGYKAPLGVLLPILVLVLFGACYLPEVIDAGPYTWAFTTVVYLVGLIIYLAGRKREARTLTGIVVHGRGNGHQFSMATANLRSFEGRSLPRLGVWKTRVMVDGKVYDGLTHVGERPTIDNSHDITIETHIPGFEADIYGHQMSVRFEEWIRETRKFDNMDALRQNIDDILHTRESLASAQHLQSKSDS